MSRDEQIHRLLELLEETLQMTITLIRALRGHVVELPAPGTVPVAGGATVEADATAGLSVIKSLQATADVQVSAQGTLVAPGTIVPLAASAGVAATTSATLEATKNLAGTASVSVQAMGELEIVSEPQLSFVPPTLASNQLLVSWVGNTFKGNDEVWVPHGGQSGWVTSDGVAYSAVIWEEHGRNIGAFRNGQVLGPRTHERNPFGGMCVTADSTYVYQPRAIKVTAQIVMRRWLRSTFDVVQGGWNGNPEPNMPIGGAGLPPAVGVNGGELFVVTLTSEYSNDFRDCPNAVMKVYNAAAWNGTVVRQWSAPRWRRITFDGSGNIWALIQRVGSTPPTIQKFSRTGAQMTGTISSVSDPTSVWWHNSRLYVGDNGPDQNIKVFNESGTLVDTIGVTGGYLQGTATKGSQGPLRFDCPTVLGIDAASNIYVNSTGLAMGGERRWSKQEYGRQGVFESYKLSDESRNWRLESLEFVDCASFDPNTGEIWTIDEVLDLRPQANPPYTYKRRTIDRGAHFTDTRNQQSGVNQFNWTAWIRTIGGNRYLYGCPQAGAKLDVWRVTASNYICTPAGTVPIVAGNNYGLWPDSVGNVWQATRNAGIHRFRFQAADPIYSTARRDTYPMPAPFKDLRRAEYHPATDVMFLAGTTFAGGDPSYDGWKTTGNLLARYDGWLNGGRTLRWQTALVPFDLAATTSTAKPVSLAHAGDYMFVGWLRRPGANGHLIKVYNAATGVFVREFDPTSAMGLVGWLDMQHSLTAYKVGSVYLLVVEESAKGKQLLYWWRP